MKHKVTITLTVDAYEYGMRGTKANAIEVVRAIIKGNADWPPLAVITLKCGNKMRRIITRDNC